MAKEEVSRFWLLTEVGEAVATGLSGGEDLRVVLEVERASHGRAKIQWKDTSLAAATNCARGSLTPRPRPRAAGPPPRPDPAPPGCCPRRRSHSRGGRRR